MPSRKTTKAGLAAEARMPMIPKEIIDQFVTGPMTATAVNDLSMACDQFTDKPGAHVFRLMAAAPVAPTHASSGDARFSHRAAPRA